MESETYSNIVSNRNKSLSGVPGHCLRTTIVPVPVRLLGAGILMVIMGMRVLVRGTPWYSLPEFMAWGGWKGLGAGAISTVSIIVVGKSGWEMVNWHT